MNRIALLGLAMIGLLVTGCGQAAQQDSQTAGTDAKNAGDTIKTDAKSAGNAIKADANNAARVGDDDLESGKINAAFSSAAGLQASNLKVSTDTSGKIITVTGTVPTLAQRDQERKIVAGIAGTAYKVKDSVTVAAATK